MKEKKIIILILIMSIILIVAIGTYALFTWTSPNTTLTLEVGKAEVIFEEGNDISVTNLGPVLDYNDGEATNFTIINKSEKEPTLSIYLNITNISDNLKDASFKYILQTSTDNKIYTNYKEGNFSNATTGKFYITEAEPLPSNITYYKFIIYIDGTQENPTSMMNNNLTATLNIESEVPITGVELGEQIKSMSNGVKDMVTDVATTDEGVWETEDDYGTTYYFRGAVENNYVQFAGYYWRIVRINGDGSIRLIYDGTSAHANGESSEDRQIGTSAFNENSNDNAYLGYMYGTPGSDTYEETHANINDSTIKTVVDNWYKTNIDDKGYSDYVADAIYCSDRKLYTGTPWVDHGVLGYGMNNTVYDITSRSSTELNVMKEIVSIKLSCSQQNDRFTVNNTNKGNGNLTYPIGLLTADEAYAAGVYYGGFEKENVNYYLYTGQRYWTISPSVYSNNAFVSTTSPCMFGSVVTEVSGVKPVLSLKSSVILTGSGTINDPYVVQP